MSTIPSTLLVCVDMQPIFLRAMADAVTLQKRCAFALSAAQGLGLPIIFSEQVPEKLGGTEASLLNLAPDAQVFAKNTFSIFANEAIRTAIKAHSPERLLICGIETPVCVYQSVRDALQQNIPATILSDAISARRSNDAQDCLKALTRDGAEILPAETVFYAMLGSVQHPFFKPYTQLVKTHG